MQTHQNNSETLPKYYRIRQSILADIHKNKYEPQSKLPSVRKLMKMYDVSFMTSRKIIDGLVRDGFAYTVQGKGCFVSTPKKKVYDSSSLIDSKRIMVIVPGDRESNYFYNLLFGIIDSLQPKGYNAEIYNSGADYVKERNLLSKCLMEPIAGLIFVPSFCNATYNHILKLCKNRIPIVLVDQHIKKYNLDWVGLDNIKTVKKSVNYLIKSGHRKIVFLGWHKNNSTSQDRLEGYKQALKEKRIEIDAGLILDMDDKYYYMMEEGAQRRMKKFLSGKKEFTAVFAYNDDLAIGAYRALKEENLRVPEDISIIGFDDSEKARNVQVPLTTIKQDVRRAGYYAAKILLKRIEDKRKTGLPDFDRPEKKTLNTKLIIRDSVRSIKISKK